MKKIFKIFTILFIIFELSSCIVDSSKTHYDIQYTNEEINKEAFDNYFISNKDLYPSYEILKENNPNILNNIKQINLSNFNSKIYRFSNDSGNGFLTGETFIYNKGNYFKLGCAWGGYGVTEFVFSQENGESWLYFIYSWGSGIHRTEIGLFNLNNSKFYFINELSLEKHIDYSLILDEDDNTIDIYTAGINPIYNEDMFNTYWIIKKELAFGKIDQMTKKIIESPKNDIDSSSSGLYYGADHTPIAKEYKEPTCLQEGYVIIGCATCDLVFEKRVLPIVDCCYVNNKCKWCGKEMCNNEPYEVVVIPQDIEYNGRHYRMLQGNYVTKEEIGELLGYIINDDDIEAFTQEFPNTIYVVSLGVYDYYNDNRVSFYSIKKYEDLSYICINVTGRYSIYQDITDLIY